MSLQTCRLETYTGPCGRQRGEKDEYRVLVCGLPNIACGGWRFAELQIEDEIARPRDVCMEGDGVVFSNGGRGMLWKSEEAKQKRGGRWLVMERQHGYVARNDTTGASAD